MRRAVLVAVLIACAGCGAQVLRYHARMAAHMAPGVSRWRAYASPGGDDPDLYTAEGRAARRLMVRYQLLGIALGGAAVLLHNLG